MNVDLGPCRSFPSWLHQHKALGQHLCARIESLAKD
jgi:hypothetical protein